MALGRNTGGRQKGSKNKPKLPLRQLAAERSEPKARLRAAAKAEAKAAEAAAKFEMAVETEQALKMPLDVMLEFMRDETNPPGFRGEMAKAAAVYCHSKAPDAQPDRVVHITELAGQGLDRRSDAKLAADKKAVRTKSKLHPR